ncbi:MAG: hypothetical protein JWQ71_1684 [Pedosphaera sp.]|nr:hypothetical protein [Pedosphaera sp.]
MLVIIAATGLLIWRWNKLQVVERRLTLIGCSIIIGLLFWVPTVAPISFLRYVVLATPVGCMLAAWVFVRGANLLSVPNAGMSALAGALVLIFTPLLSLPPLILIKLPAWARVGILIRPELKTLCISVFGHQPDPNRLVIDWLKENAASTDEILINYEDIPLMFYLPNPIRGGMTAFRVEDDAKTLPRFAVLRREVSFVYWPAYNREGLRHDWELIPLKAPDIFWGNNPDPMGQAQNPAAAPDLWFARRVEKKVP